MAEREGKAFVGISVGCKIFTKPWVKKALYFMLDRHKSVLFLLADELLRYTRVARIEEEGVKLEIEKTSKIIKERSEQWQKFLISEINQFFPKSESCVEIRNWSYFSDSLYSYLLRNLFIAYEQITSFRDEVNKVAESHIALIGDTSIPTILPHLEAMFILDEIAMCLRVTELDEYRFEYYPSDQIEVLKQLYCGNFQKYGLTVNALTGSPIKREFQVISINEL
jgi:hypothetical protein